MSDRQDLGDELMEQELLPDGPALRLGKRSASVRQRPAFQSYEEGLAQYCSNGMGGNGGAPGGGEHAGTAARPAARRRKIEQAIDFIEKEKEIYEEQTFQNQAEVQSHALKLQELQNVAEKGKCL